MNTDEASKLSHPHEFKVHIDQRPYTSPNPTTGEALYKLGHVKPGLKLYREVTGDREDSSIENGPEIVHLKADEHFHSGEPQDKPEVVVLDLNTNREVKFRVAWTDTLQKVWDEAYLKLREAKRERDQFECSDGHSLMSQLNLTIHQLRERHICGGFKFQIKGDTGGA